MTPSPTAPRRDPDQAQRALSRIRRDQAQPWRTWPVRLGAAIGRGIMAILDLIVRFLSGILELIMEALGEALLAVLALALFAGVVAVGIWGWSQSPAATVVLAVGLLGFLAFGAYESTAKRFTRNRIVALASGSAVFVVIWLSYVLLYL
ncbi:hypothetical protein [Alloactinosynnema sp. L-07]|uniref:hypothetical protein n=1 Tax=Alloactinosynnema sp. L-07 TaxID=1653480 RepID=UPI00065EFCDF|nr:hypothetical protein [Alloactinosynnema sp. L-07]CRK58395.1 hypothetical protein [Alloactinosynnema sp. L-07]